jgi:hypothetical protein
MELYFTSSPDKLGPFTEPKQFVELINRNKPRESPSDNSQGRWSTSATTRETADDIRVVLGRILDKVGDPDKVGEQTYNRKLTLIILTDGIWKGIGDKRGVADTIVSKLGMWIDKIPLKELMDERGLSLQFVRFGDDRSAREELEYLDDNLTNSRGERLP